jgi:hypothetical protein
LDGCTASVPGFSIASQRLLIQGFATTGFK